MAYIGSQMLQGYRPRPAERGYGSEEDAYMRQVERGSERSYDAIRDAGREEAAHARDMWKTYAEMPEKIYGGYMAGRRFRADMDEEDRRAAKFAEEQATAPQRKAVMEQQLQNARLQQQQAEEQLSSIQDERKFMNAPVTAGRVDAKGEMVPGMTRREQMYADNQAMQKKLLDAQLGGVAFQQQQVQKQDRIQAAAAEIQRELAMPRQAPMNANNPSFAPKVADSVAKKYGLQPAEASIALSQAQSAIAQGAASRQVLEQNQPGYWRQQDAIAQAQADLGKTTEMLNSFQEYLKEQGSLASGSPTWDTTRANEARTQFASYLEASGKTELAASIKNGDLGREMVDTRMKEATLSELNDAIARIRRTPGLQSNPEAVGILRQLEQTRQEVANSRTGIGRFFAGGAKNDVKGAYVPTPMPQGGKVPFVGPQPGMGQRAYPTPSTGPQQIPNQRVPPSIRQKQIHKPTTAQNTRPMGGG